MNESHCTDEQRQFLKEYVQGRSYPELAALFNERFGTNLGRLVISKRCRSLGLSNGRPERRPYTTEQLEFLRANAEGRRYDELAVMFNRRFGTAVTRNMVGELCRRNGFPNGLSGLYQEGHTTNLGRKFDRSLPDGSEFVNAAGYTILKHNGVWRGKHTVLWEQAHGRPVPEGHYIVFGDGNKRNFNVDNLFCVSPAQNGFRSVLGLKGESPELAEAGVALAKLYERINERKRRQ